MKQSKILSLLVFITLIFCGCDEQHMPSRYFFSDDWWPMLILMFFLFGLLGFYKPKPTLGLVPLFFYAIIIISEVILFPTSHNLLPFVLLGGLFYGCLNWVGFFIGKSLREHIDKKKEVTK